MPDVKEVINGLEMSYKYSNVDENNTLVPQWIVLHAITLLKAQEPRAMADTELEAIRKAPIILKPNVDAVPVVRCRDCKHRDPEDKKCDYGGMAVQGLFFPRPDNWFCADGERRDERAVDRR